MLLTSDSSRTEEEARTGERLWQGNLTCHTDLANGAEAALMSDFGLTEPAACEPDFADKTDLSMARV